MEIIGKINKLQPDQTFHPVSNTVICPNMRKTTLENDAHAVRGIVRQVSLLVRASIDKMRGLGLELHPGDFAENLTVSGMELAGLPVGTRLKVGGEIVLETGQIGKACRKGCAIFKAVGACVMPKEGVFARVVQNGKVRTGDDLEIM